MSYIRRKTIYYLVSELSTFDGTGIHRVTKAIFNILNDDLNDDLNFIAIYGDTEGSFHYSKRYLNHKKEYNENIIFYPEDMILSVDLVYDLPEKLRDKLLSLKRKGIPLYFILYDLIPVRYTKWFEGDSVNVEREQYLKLFKDWIHFICMNANGILCISQSVMKDLQSYLKENYYSQLVLPKVDFFHLGFDIKSSTPSKGLSLDSEKMLNSINKSINFLMVGTVEPRKGHMKILNAFEVLWNNGYDINLIIVGKKGWLVEDLALKILDHKELGNHLYWLTNTNDEYLERIYSASTCLIAASEAEGFGLPIIEAAYYKLPIIANDIDIFRELCGENAFFISSLSTDECVRYLKKWLLDFSSNKHIKSHEISILTWKDSVRQLIFALEKMNHLKKMIN